MGGEGGDLLSVNDDSVIGAMGAATGRGAR